MNDQDDDSREATTLAPDTDRADRDTSPPDPIVEAKLTATMLPGAPSVPAPPEYWKAAYEKLVEIHEDQKAERVRRDAREQENEDRLVARLLAGRKVLDDKLVSIATTVESTARDVQKLTPRVAEVEAKLTELQKAHTSFKVEMESKLAEMWAEIESLQEHRDDDEGSASPPAVTP